MAQQQTITYVDDIDGKEIADNDKPTVSFSLDGTNYEIDLGDKNQEKLRKALEPYIKAGRKSGGTSRGTKRSTKTNAKEVRDWARSNGFTVPDRGRIPAAVQEAFDAK